MSVTAITLVLISALVHAGWNLLGKRDSADGAYFCVASAVGAVVLLPFLVVWGGAVTRMPPAVWAYLVPTGLFQGLYFVGLAGAYRNGDLSVAYPVARAFPVLMVPAITAVLGVGERPTAPAVAGMVVVAAGLLVIPQERLLRLSVRRLLGPWALYALLAGVGTAGYSVVDDAALQLYRSALNGAAFQAPIIYAAFQSLSTALFLALFGVARMGRSGFRSAVGGIQLRSATAAGVAIVVAYGLVLVAYGFARNVSYVVAFRQVSLPLGAVLGVTLLGEKLGPARAAGAALIVTGLVLVSLG